MAPNTLQEKAQKYFADLNPLAAKIYSDISVISDAYAHLWTGFSIEEQHDVINVTMIKPEVVLKYFSDISKVADTKKPSIGQKTDADIDDNLSFASSNHSNSFQSNFNHIYLYNGKDLCTYQQIITALKYSQDDVCGVYRDEHSEPFNSKTKSQMNLNFTPSSTNTDGLHKANVKSSAAVLDPDLRKGIDYLFDANGKCSTLKMENMQDCRKSFMSKLFSGKSNTLRISPVPQFDATSEAGSARNPSEVRISLTQDFDSMSTKSAHSDEKPEPTDQSRLIAEKESQREEDECDNYQKADSFELSGSYDFLSNW